MTELCHKGGWWFLQTCSRIKMVPMDWFPYWLVLWARIMQFSSALDGRSYASCCAAESHRMDTHTHTEEDLCRNRQKIGSVFTWGRESLRAWSSRCVRLWVQEAACWSTQFECPVSPGHLMEPAGQERCNQSLHLGYTHTLMAIAYAPNSY